MPEEGTAKGSGPPVKRKKVDKNRGRSSAPNNDSSTAGSGNKSNTAAKSKRTRRRRSKPNSPTEVWDHAGNIFVQSQHGSDVAHVCLFCFFLVQDKLQETKRKRKRSRKAQDQYVWRGCCFTMLSFGHILVTCR